MAWPRDPMMVIVNECWVHIQLLMPFMSPFSNMIRAVFPPPYCASTCKDWVISLEFFKWTTGFRKNAGITAENPTTASPELFAAVLHETFVHVAVYGSGISAEWKICGISALAYRQEREPFCCCCSDWLLHMSFQWSSWSGAQFLLQ